MVNLDNANDSKLKDEILLFSESQSRCIVSLNKINIQKLKDIASKNNISVKLIGVVGGNNMIIEGMLSLDLSHVYELWNGSFEAGIQ